MPYTIVFVNYIMCQHTHTYTHTSSSTQAPFRYAYTNVVGSPNATSYLCLNVLLTPPACVTYKTIITRHTFLSA